MLNAFTVDLEDWYQGIGIPIEKWNVFEKRIRIGADKLIKLLSKFNVRATFFVLGKVIEDHPDLLKDIISDGHEIGCHGYSHKELFLINEKEFEKEIEKCNHLISGFSIKYKGFRAPYFSIDKRTMWALDILKKYNFIYDTSIFPGDSKRTGIKGYRKDIHQIENRLWEVPVTTFDFLNFDIGTGGAYFRMLPLNYFLKRIEKFNQNNSIIFYIHPWELDPEHPYLSYLPFRRKLPHYYNLNKTINRLEVLLKNFRFCPLIHLIENKNE